MNITEQLTKTTTLYKKNKNSDSLRRSTVEKETDVYQDQTKIDECSVLDHNQKLWNLCWEDLAELVNLYLAIGNDLK